MPWKTPKSAEPTNIHISIVRAVSQNHFSVEVLPHRRLFYSRIAHFHTFYTEGLFILVFCPVRANYRIFYFTLHMCVLLQ